MAKKVVGVSRNARRVRKPSQGRIATKPVATSKIDALIAALRAPKGATIAQLSQLTGWQPHSVRGAMSGALKKKRGFAIISTKSGVERVYRIGGKS